MSDRSVRGFCPDEAQPGPDHLSGGDRDVTVADILMLALVALAAVLAVGLLASGW